MKNRLFFALFLGLIGFFLSDGPPRAAEAANQQAQKTQEVRGGSSPVRKVNAKQDHITELKFSGEQKHIEIPFAMPGGKTGVVLLDIDKKVPGFERYILRVKDQEFKVFEAYDIGFVRLRGNDHEDVFFTEGEEYFSLFVFCPQERELLELDIGPTHKMISKFDTVNRSDNFSNLRLQKERKFLEQRKYEYGYLEELESDLKDPDNAAYYWRKDNGKVDNGPLTIRKYKSPIDFGGEIEDTVTIGNITYNTRYRQGVEGYDKQTGEYYFMYYPASYYTSITALDHWGPYLIIGAELEGLIFINTETFHLKSYKLKEKLTWTKEAIEAERDFRGEGWEPESEYELIIDKIEVLESEILVNDYKKVAFPDF